MEASIVHLVGEFAILLIAIPTDVPCALGSAVLEPNAKAYPDSAPEVCPITGEVKVERHLKAHVIAVSDFAAMSFALDRHGVNRTKGSEFLLLIS